MNGTDRSGELTLAFELSAFQQFANPQQVIADADAWSRYVGIVANDAEAVRTYVREHHLRQDFTLGDQDKWLALSSIRERTDTPRHVFVGRTPDDRRAAEGTGWEFVPLHEAAQKADWDLDTQQDRNVGLLEAIRRRLPLDWP